MGFLENEDEQITMQLELIKRSVDKLSEANYALHNAILTINGIFISFLSIATVVNNKISKCDIILIGLFTGFPILLSLLSFLFQKIGHIKMIEIQHSLTKNPNYQETKKGQKQYKSLRNIAIFSSTFLQFTEIPSIILTITSVFYIFFVVIRW